MAHAVEVAGVDEGDAGIDGGVDGGEALGLVGRAVHAAHAHASEGNGEDFRAGAAKFARLNGGCGGHGGNISVRDSSPRR